VRPTIHTVAERAGVSIATVSRLLNGSTRVSQETAEKVRRAIDELGYLPNASARGLVTSATGTLAVIFPKLSGPFFSELIRGAEAGAQEAGYHLLIYGASSVAGEPQGQMLRLLATKVDGLILASGNIPLDFARDVQRWGVPVVILGRQPDNISVDSIRPDNLKGAVKVVSHLIEHGYRRIAMITGRSTHLHAADREAGYRRALHDHGLRIHAELVTQEPLTKRAATRRCSGSYARGPFRRRSSPPAMRWRSARWQRCVRGDCGLRMTWRWWGSMISNRRATCTVVDHGSPGYARAGPDRCADAACQGQWIGR
jgi:LacI family transcriptional regulator